MTFTETHIKGLWGIEPKVYTDSRGYFMEAWKKDEFKLRTGVETDFIQMNESKSSKGVLRGLHFQLPPFDQAKLVRVIVGTVMDVAVDIRKDSPTFGQYYSIELSEDNKLQFYIPRGFAHGFQVLSEKAVFSYMVDNVYASQAERCIRFDDPTVGVCWKGDPDKFILSDKDKKGLSLSEAKLELFS
jgi:dTDP-4-dehydrorhamnose 3,5-epimerase